MHHGTDFGEPVAEVADLGFSGVDEEYPRNSVTGYTERYGQRRESLYVITKLVANEK